MYSSNEHLNSLLRFQWIRIKPDELRNSEFAGFWYVKGRLFSPFNSIQMQMVKLRQCNKNRALSPFCITIGMQ